MFPIIPLMALFSILGGGFTLNWYYKLPKNEQEKVGLQANELALKLFKKKLDELNSYEAKIVAAKTQQQLNS